MKILPVMCSQNTLTKSAPIKYNRFEVQQDTFTKTHAAYSPSFGDSTVFKQLAQKVLGNPDLRQMYAKYAAETFLALLGIAGGKELAAKSGNSDELYKFLEEIPTDITTEKEQSAAPVNDAELEELRTENERLIRENSDLKEENSTLTARIADMSKQTQSDNPSENTTTETNTPTKVSKHRCKHLQFPKKNGRLSKGQERLKQVVQSLRLNNDEYTKLTAICKKSLEKNTYVVNDKEVDNNTLAASLAEELEQNKKEPEETIDKYYKLFGFEPADDNSSEVEVGIPEEKIGGTRAQSESDDNINPNTAKGEDNTSAEIQAQQGGALVAESNGNPVSTTTALPVVDCCHVQVMQFEVDPTSFHDQGQKVVLIDRNADIYSYYDSVAYNQELDDILKNMQKRFESAVFRDKKKNQRVNWMTKSKTAYKITDKAVENEIRSLMSKSGCEHINLDNVSDLADAINADARFGQYFTLHAAIRLIDRFANFDSDSIPLEDQCSEMLNSFDGIIKRAFHNRINIKLYVDEKGDFGERILISPSLYLEQDKKYFKDKPLILGLGKLYSFSKADRPPVVVTIFNE